MFEDRLTKLKGKLERLEGIMPAKRGRILNSVYGHCFPMNPTATQEQVAAFEHKYNSVLPVDYREFIQQVGDGGLGGTGINALCRESNKTEIPYNVVTLAPFPFVWQEEVDEETGETYSGFFTSWDDLKDDGKNYDLAINFFCEGCDRYLYLVLTGDEKGTVWRVLMESDDRCYGPDKIGDQERVSFLEWFEHWLEKVLGDAEQALARGIPVFPHGS